MTADEIVTAHAKPVARKVDALAALPVDRRIRTEKNKPERETFRIGALRWDSSQRSLESLGLAALMLLGLLLIGVGATMLYEDSSDGIAILAATALCAPGIAAVLLATVGFVLAPRVKVRAD